MLKLLSSKFYVKEKRGRSRRKKLGWDSGRKGRTFFWFQRVCVWFSVAVVVFNLSQGEFPPT